MNYLIYKQKIELEKNMGAISGKKSNVVIIMKQKFESFYIFSLFPQLTETYTFSIGIVFVIAIVSLIIITLLGVFTLISQYRKNI